MEHEQPPPRAPRRRGRTTALIAAALVLGALAGTVTGYAIQYGRKPTPLPPLAQQQMATPKAQAPNDATTIKSVNANRWHKTDDDLTKLLADAPAGAKVEFDGYDTLDTFVTGFDTPGPGFRHLLDIGFRRVATRSWEQGDVYVEVQLLQFRDFKGADGWGGWQEGSDEAARMAGNDGAAIPGVPSDAGHLWVHSKTTDRGGPGREARAVARRGDIAMWVFYYDRRGGAIAESDIAEVAKRQWERL
ncbi:hypothetical protein [Streptomyces sp. NPDC006670]|uniref:hypothetical protein n=1 Tax=unclassified Streptomyces TaxID=2593676 RepID=UPI0033D6D71A